jgi:hypothetical protein
MRLIGAAPLRRASPALFCLLLVNPYVLAARWHRACPALARCAVLGLLLVLVTPSAWAQAASPPASRSDEAAAALERAQRLADSPMRAILEAGRLPRRAAVAETVAAPAVVLTLAALGLDAEAPPPVSELPSPQAALPMAALDAAALLPRLPDLPVDDPLLPVPEVPQLQQMVEPQFTQRLLDQVGSFDVVEAMLSLRAEGTVADVNFIGAVDLRVQTAVRRALLQWRYAPLRTAQEHRVRLEFAQGR